MRKYVTLPVGRSCDRILLLPVHCDAAEFSVRQGNVLDGLIRAIGAWLATGMSASATPLLSGPTTPATMASPIMAVTLALPTAASCAPLGPTSFIGSNCS